jgi:hypothetical protein
MKQSKTSSEDFFLSRSSWSSVYVYITFQFQFTQIRQPRLLFTRGCLFYLGTGREFGLRPWLHFYFGRIFCIFCLSLAKNIPFNYKIKICYGTPLFSGFCQNTALNRVFAGYHYNFDVCLPKHTECLKQKYIYYYREITRLLLRIKPVLLLI